MNTMLSSQHGFVRDAWSHRLDCFRGAIGEFIKSRQRRAAAAMGNNPACEEDESAQTFGYSLDLSEWRVRGDPLDRVSLRLGLDEVEEAILVAALAPHLSPDVSILAESLGQVADNGGIRALFVLALLGGDEQDTISLRRYMIGGARLRREGLVSGFNSGSVEAQDGILPNPLLIHLATGGALEEFELPSGFGLLPDAPVSAPPIFRLPAFERLLAATKNEGRLAAVKGDEKLLLDPMAIKFAAMRCARPVLEIPAVWEAEDLCSLKRQVKLMVRLSRAIYFCPPAANGEQDKRGVLLSALVSKRDVVLAPRSLSRTLSCAIDAPPLLLLDVPSPSADERAAVWMRALEHHGVGARASDISYIARQFPIGAQSIRMAACDAAASRDDDEMGQQPVLDRARLADAVANHICGSMQELAPALTTNVRLDDLVLPSATRKRVLEVVAALDQRDRVFADWGFSPQSDGAGNLTILFAGASGTGKTATAAAIGAELDGYVVRRVRLPTLVSKYIGETTKNLERVFEAASRSNAILFFDEADAIFGKRSEANDANDRYANLDTAYLLQRIETFEGVVILATNLAKNIDEAFLRRIHFTVDFPRPGGSSQGELWRKIVPSKAPLAADVDLESLARLFEFTGGEIRTIALDAAMRAAARGESISMADFVRSIALLRIKKGEPIQHREFRPFEAFLDGL